MLPIMEDGCREHRVCLAVNKALVQVLEVADAPRGNGRMVTASEIILVSGMS